MKLAYLVKKFPRLSETFVLGEILGQEALGTDVHVFSRRAADDELRHPQFERLRAECEVLPSVRVINPWEELFRSELAIPDLLERIRAVLEGLRGFDLPRLPALLAEALYLKRRCLELDIGHVHVHFATEAALTAMLLHDLGGPTFSVTAHAKDIYRSTVDLRVLERIIRSSEFVVTVCDANVDFLVERIGPVVHERVRRLYNGIDLEAFTTSGEQRIPGRIVAVGRMVEKKGFDTLVEALVLLRGGGQSFSAVFAGEGEEREQLMTLVARYGLEDQVEFIGAVDQGRVQELLAESEVFCLPCRVGVDGNRDALPTVMLESQAAGLPIISTPVTGIPEILDQGAAGVLVPEDDPARTAEALGRLLSDAPLRFRIAQRGLRRASDLFDSRVNARTLGTWFDECLGAARLRSEERSCALPT